MESSLSSSIQKGIISALLAAFFVLSGTVAQAAELFGSSFETGNFTEWSLAGADWYTVNNAAGAHEGNNRAEGRGDSTGTGSVLVKYLDVSGYEALTLSFWYQIPDNGFEVGETLTIDTTTDGGANWDNLMTFTDGDEQDVWTHFETLLPAADISGFGVRFMTNAGSASDVFKLDAVSITGEEIVVEIDTDADGLLDDVDNCPVVPNPDQADFDNDGEGDVCDDDIDGDGIPNDEENEGCIYDTDLLCGVEIDDDVDDDGVLDDADLCPATVADEAGSLKLNPNHWRFDTIDWLLGTPGGGVTYASAYTMTDTKGCGCDQVLTYLGGITGESYNGQWKFGCTSGTIEEFMSVVW